MICQQCKHELDAIDEETIEQINAYSETKAEPICNDCLWKQINEMETVQ